MVRSDFVSAAGTLDERLPSWQDREWCIRLSRHCRFDSIEDPLVLRRIHGRDQISDDFEAKRDVTYPLLLEKYRDVAAEQGPRTERRYVASLSASVARAGIQNGRYRDAVRYLLKSIKHSPTNVRAYPYLVLASGGKYLCEPAQLAKRRVRQLADATGVASTDADRYQGESPFSPTERAE